MTAEAKTRQLVYVPSDIDKPVERRAVAVDDLPALQALVGGHLECIHLGANWLWCNEDGLALGLQPNVRIWNMFRTNVKGDVFLTGDVDSKGDWTSAPMHLWHMARQL